MSPLRLARLSLLRHPFATTITAVAIALSVACGGILLRLNQISESRFSAMGSGGDAIVGAKAGGIEILLNALNGEGEFPDFLPYKLFESLKSQQAVHFEDGHTADPQFIQNLVPFVYFAKLENFRIIGTDANFFKKSISFAEGNQFQQPGEVVLGSFVASSKNLKVGNHIKANPWVGADVTSSEFDLKVTGILAKSSTQWDRSLFTNVEQAQKIFSENMTAVAKKSIWGADVLHYFLVDVKPTGFASLEALINRRTVGQVVKIDEQKKRLQEISTAGTNVGLFVTFFVILLGGLSVCAMLVTRFEGMSLQLAVLRALGYSKRELISWLVWEGFLLACLGVFFGALVDALGFPIIRSLLGTALPPTDLVSSNVFQSAPIWLIAMIATILSIIIPAIRLSRQDTHNSLRGL